MSDDQKELVKKQFGRSSSAYATSDIHARGESLQVLSREISCQKNWSVLDIATGAGHTALMFAEAAQRVVATDLTQSMLDRTLELAQQKGLENVDVQIADAEQLPFDDGSFDLVTCRLAFHHFPDRTRAASEMHRVLKQGGYLGFTDNFTVENDLSKELYNQFERIRDPSHDYVGSLDGIQKVLEKSGFSLTGCFQMKKEFEFHEWADRQQVSDSDKDKLLSLMRNFPSDLQEFFDPRWEEDTLFFYLHEAVIIGQKSSN